MAVDRTEWLAELREMLGGRRRRLRRLEVPADFVPQTSEPQVVKRSAGRPRRPRPPSDAA